MTTESNSAILAIVVKKLCLTPRIVPQLFSFVKGKYHFLGLFFLLVIVACSSQRPSGSSYEEQHIKILDRIGKKGFSCQNPDDYNYVDFLLGDMGSKVKVTTELSRRLGEEPQNAGYLAFQDALLIDGCPFNGQESATNVSVNLSPYRGSYEMSLGTAGADVARENRVALVDDPFDYSTNNLVFEIDEKSLVVDAQPQISQVKVRFDLYLIHNFESYLDNPQTIVLSKIKLADHNNNIASLKEKDIPPFWYHGILRNEANDIYIFQNLVANKIFRLPLSFDLVNYSAKQSSYYDFSVVVKGKKFLLRVSNLAASN